MPNVVDVTGLVVFTGKSDAECVRWWKREGEENDRLEDTGESMLIVAEELMLED